MGAPRDIRRYTEKWMDLFNQIQDDPKKDIVMECATEKEAKLLRLEFYKAREALHRDEATLKAQGAEAYNENGHPNVDRVEVRVVGDNVIFGFKDSSRIATIITNALEKLRNQEGQQHDERTE